MSTLNDYLIEKRAAVLARDARIAAGTFAPVRLAASASTVDAAAAPLVSALDIDGDGTLSLDEIEEAPWALTALDTNHDGIIAPSERRVPEAVTEIGN